MVVMQPWFGERRLSLGAAAQGQCYLSTSLLVRQRPPNPIFRAQSALSRPRATPCSALTATCMCPAGTANGVGTVANGAGAGTASMAGIAAATAAAAALSGRADDAFSSILRPSQFGSGCRTYGVGRNTAVGRRLGGSRAAPGGPGPVSCCSGGVPGAMARPAKVAGSRDAVPLALFARRSISSMPEGVKNAC